MATCEKKLKNTGTIFLRSFLEYIYRTKKVLKKCTIQYRKSFFSSLAELRQHLEEDHSRKEAGAAAENLGSITVQMYNLKCPYVTCGHQTFRYGTNNS